MNDRTVTQDLQQQQQPQNNQFSLILRNQNAQQEEQKKQQEQKKPQKKDMKLQWAEDTIDNEDMGKLKSKVCCIFHKANGESSDTCTSDDEANEYDRDRISKKKHKENCSKHKGCQHNKNNNNKNIQQKQ
ncbi:hypothetical protein PPERSA_06078 [Pseudocohnilembus persalinus]|uniref:Type 1 phosphatases regulator n=1 Tax=Pseudocohnilembus persalinus TaxID=266149 RepID=A0A0V0QVG3_PSEPJ|nr:hypothetical protein PPERSA_06078 [Pseudocohnilembus persalinus]|eukprot:KRX06196.1 hypothetical protein PPERSA_06078 [Pseudocohnilembus persalinus]